MHSRSAIPLLVAALLLPLTGSRAPGAEDPQEKPLDLGLVEKTEQRLVQLDVSVRPKKGREHESLPDLAPGDLELVVAGRRIAIRYVDRLCQAAPTSKLEAPEPAGGAPAPAKAETAPAVPPTAHGTYVFYFEHRHLTMQGQEIALKMAENLIPRLIVDGNRGMVVSSGGRLIQTEITDDPAKLLNAIRDIRTNTGQWSETMYAEQEVSRYGEIFRQAKSPAAQRGLASTFQNDEVRSTNNRLGRFAATLGSLADLDPPKVALYFADTIRKNPGEHYAQLFDSGGEYDFDVSAMQLKSFAAGAAFDRVTKTAGAFGVRLYTIQAQGLVTLGMEEARNQSGLNRMPTKRLEDAEQTMAALALETGGATFKGGLDSGTLGRVLERIQSDLGCVWVLSFPGDGLPVDEQLPVRVRFNPDAAGYAERDRDFDLSARGVIVVQSAGKRKESVLLAAHAARGPLESDAARGVIIPLAFQDGKFSALVQMVVASPDFARQVGGHVDWEVGLTHVAHDHVEHQVSTRVEVSDPGAPLVLEAEWVFPPGKSEVTGVAYENRFGQLAAMHLEVEWPNPNDAPASIGTITVVQPVEGAFVRKTDDHAQAETRSHGTLAIGESPALTDRPTWIVSLMCRSRRTRGDLWIERRLGGTSSVDFPLQKWEWDADSLCVQTRDLIQAGVMGWGSFKYEARIHADPVLEGKPLAEKSIEFKVQSPAPLQPGQPKGSSIDSD